MVTIDVVSDILDALGRQGTPPVVLAELRSLYDDTSTIDAARYQPQRNAELKVARQTVAVEKIKAELLALEKAMEAEAETVLVEHDAARHEAAVKANGVGAIDMDRLRHATNAAEVNVLLKDAEAAGPDYLRRAWPYAEPILTRLAAKEQREYRSGGASAFAALCSWQLRLKSLTARVPDRAALADAQRAKKQALRQQVLTACAVFGLDKLVKHAATKATIPDPPKGTTTQGRFFDQFGKR